MEALPVVKEVKASDVDECIIAAGSALHTHGTSDMDIDDLNAFPALSSHRTQAAARIFLGVRATKPERELTPEEPIPEITPENVPQTVAGGEPSKRGGKEELAEDWVVVSPGDAQTANPLCVAARESFDRQHPRNMFAKKTASKPISTVAFEEDCSGFDWSRAGMPTELIRRLIRGTANAAHRSAHSEKKSMPVPNHVLRAQNVGSAKRQKSASKVPRSQSRPCAVRQPSSRRR